MIYCVIIKRHARVAAYQAVIQNGYPRMSPVTGSIIWRKLALRETNLMRNGLAMADNTFDIRGKRGLRTHPLNVFSSGMDTAVQLARNASPASDQVEPNQLSGLYEVVSTSRVTRSVKIEIGNKRYWRLELCNK